MTWFWMSFADPKRPKGQQFLGVAIVEADEFLHAVSISHRLGINPGGEIAGYVLPQPPPAGMQHRLLTKAEAEAYVEDDPRSKKDA